MSMPHQENFLPKNLNEKEVQPELRLSPRKIEIVQKVEGINKVIAEGNTMKREIFIEGARKEEEFLNQQPESENKRAIKICQMLGAGIAEKPEQFLS